MPNGFTLPPLFRTRMVNSFDLDYNCYYVSVAALLGTTVLDLTGETELMQNITGSDDDIKGLFRAAGVTVESREFTNGRELYNILLTLSQGESVGLAYSRRGEEIGHMVVVQRDEGFFPDSPAPGICCMDFQKTPTQVLPFPPEPNIDRAWIYYQV